MQRGVGVVRGTRYGHFIYGVLFCFNIVQCLVVSKCIQEAKLSLG